MKLFSEPFDLDEIERALHTDTFMSLAHFTVGREENWCAGLDQVARLLPLFEEAGRDHMPIYAMASMLVRRTGQLREPSKRLDEAVAKLGILPGPRRSVTPPDGAK
jgi:hypothetical protein